MFSFLPWKSRASFRSSGPPGVKSEFCTKNQDNRYWHFLDKPVPLGFLSNPNRGNLLKDFADGQRHGRLVFSGVLI